MIFLGVDTGGTFTDFVVLEHGQMRVHKVLSTPAAPEQAIFQGITELGLQEKPLTVIHGSTVATNAALEGKGVKTAYVTNKGLKDVLTIGRQARPQLYNLQPQMIKPPVDAALCLEVDCRLSAEGNWLVGLSESELDNLGCKIRSLDVEAVAVNLLFSYLDDAAELAIKKHLPDELFISLSSQVLSEIGEYERGIATWLNAWVGPLIQGYVNRLQQGLRHSHLSVMQSSGETMDATQAASQAVRMLLSGPAGGLVGARFVAGKSALTRLMTFDMGGTSTDVALIDKRLQLTNRGRIGNYPVAVPMVDMHTIGAGGGSIAKLDTGGMLQVGPESAGAQPGPACYAQGGVQPTVTDANLLLGRIPQDTRLGGYMPLDKQRSQQVMQQLANAMGVTLEQAAAGIISIANEHMARALRVISVQKGYDPADFTLVSFGGAGGMHVCALADELQMQSALVPVHAGVLSALGMLATRPGRQLSNTLMIPLKTLEVSCLLDEFEKLRQKGVSALKAEGLQESGLQTAYSLDLRYQGQSNTLNVYWSDKLACEAGFHQLHEKRYGHRLSMPVELVNVRVSVTAAKRDFSLLHTTIEQQRGARTKNPATATVPVYQRKDLSDVAVINGPAIIAEPVATTWVAEGWVCRVDKIGNLLLSKH